MDSEAREENDLNGRFQGVDLIYVRTTLKCAPRLAKQGFLVKKRL